MPALPAGAGLPDVCGAIAEETERAEGIPPGLVRAVTLVELGRWLAEDRRTQAWPWTVTAGPETYYLASKHEALRKVKELRARGRSNIDVGCMQVNLGYHGDRLRLARGGARPGQQHRLRREVPEAAAG